MAKFPPLRVPSTRKTILLRVAWLARGVAVARWVFLKILSNAAKAGNSPRGMDHQISSCAWEITGRGLEPAAMVPLSDRGFRFGQHLFETLSVRAGRWLFFEEHETILDASAKEADFRCDTAARKILSGLPTAGELRGFKEGIARIFWTAGDGSPSCPPSSGRLFLFCEPCVLPARQPALHLHTGPFPFAFPLSRQGAWKTGNYWQNVAARQKAASEGCDEILAANPSGNICSASMGNIFFQLDGKWFTPPMLDGARPGTTRNWLLGMGFAGEQSLSSGEISSVSSWMVTNSRLGPAHAFSGHSKAVANPEVVALWRRWMDV